MQYIINDKLIYESIYNETKTTLEFNPNLDIHELMQEFKQLALAIGFHPDSVDDGFEAMAEEIEICRDSEKRDNPEESTEDDIRHG